MADIRIKDLTTTASSTASDDFIAVDGTTNGTRKLNAFSPTFGGNATVTGTLTVNGVATASAGISIGDGTFGAGKIYTSATGGLSLGAKTGSSYDFILADPSGNLIAYVPTGTTRMVLSSTTASTTTSTGALVVGNGTSGGLGVGGAIWAGGDITISTNAKAFYNLNYANAKGQQAGFFSRGTDGAWTAGMHFYSSNTDYSASIIHFPGTGDLQFYTNSTSSNYTSSDEALRITPAKQIQVKATTASTSTSSGALVVSGGVGVAGAIVAGSFIRSAGANNISLGADAGKNRIDAGGATDTPVRALGTADALTGIEMRLLGVIDGTSAPAATAGYAKLYVDSADGDLKVIFGDGTVKTIATDS